MIPRHTLLHADRYVPLRKGTSTEHLAFDTKANHQTAYTRLLTDQQRRCLSFSVKKTFSTCCSEKSVGLASELKAIKEKKINPNMVKKIEANQIIYAPNVADNFYSQPLDWSSYGRLCVSLKRECYTYQNNQIEAVRLAYYPFKDNYSITSVKFNKQGELLYVGDSEGTLFVYDAVAETLIRSMTPHSSRIGCIENTFEWGFLTGSKDCSIAHHDLRIKNSVFMKLVAHKDEVCGISVQNNKVASGGRNGQVLIWNLNSNSYFQNHKIHKGAVKALQWCPWRVNLLATGGGSDDRKIVMWNSETQEVEEVLSGNSQVTQLIWRNSSRDLVTAHGGNRSLGYGMIWSSKIKEFTHVLEGHKGRIVGLAVSPSDQSKIVTLGADQTMRLWRTRETSQPIQPERAEQRQSLITPMFK